MQNTAYTLAGKGLKNLGEWGWGGGVLREREKRDIHTHFIIPACTAHNTLCLHVPDDHWNTLLQAPNNKSSFISFFSDSNMFVACIIMKSVLSNCNFSK